MTRPSVVGGAVAGIGAVLSSLCCVLPIAVILLGLGSGAFMAVTMQYRWFLIPTGALSVGTGFVLYARERRRCNELGCRMAGSRITLALLIVASAVVATAIMLVASPTITSDLIMWAAGEAGTPAAMGGNR